MYHRWLLGKTLSGEQKNGDGDGSGRGAAEEEEGRQAVDRGGGGGDGTPGVQPPAGEVVEVLEREADLCR
jgi:hypothetical protein